MAGLKIYTDENVNVRIAQGLRKRGIKAFSALEKGMIGCKDVEHFEYAVQNKAVILTHDHHFIKIAKNTSSDHWGVIFAEMNRFSVGECIRRVSLYAELLSAEEMKGRIEFL